MWITGKRVEEKKSSLNSNRAVWMCLFDIQMSKWKQKKLKFSETIVLEIHLKKILKCDRMKHTKAWRERGQGKLELLVLLNEKSGQHFYFLSLPASKIECHFHTFSHSLYAPVRQIPRGIHFSYILKGKKKFKLLLCYVTHIIHKDVLRWKTLPNFYFFSGRT